MARLHNGICQISYKFRLYPSGQQEQKLLENKMSESIKKSWQDPIKRKNRIIGLRKVLQTKEYKKKMSEIKKGFIPITVIKKGQKLSNKHKKAISLGRLRLKEKQGFLNSERARKKHSVLFKEKYKDKNFKEMMIKNSLKGLLKRPTSLEKEMIIIIGKNKLPYKYVGDGSFLIGFKNPDFIKNNGQKFCIEVANTYHHNTTYPKERKLYFKKFGWRCVVFRTNKLNELTVLRALNETEPLPIGQVQSVNQEVPFDRWG